MCNYHMIYIRLTFGLTPGSYIKKMIRFATGLYSSYISVSQNRSYKKPFVTMIPVGRYLSMRGPRITNSKDKVWDSS